MWSGAFARWRGRRRAGYRARQRYEAQRKNWLRAKRPVFALVAVAMAVAISATRLVCLLLPASFAGLSWMVTGALVSMWIGLRLSPPGIVGRWQEGAWGEERTARELIALERGGWLVLNDVGHGRYNFDHVVIGEQGIFCINSKWSNSRLTVTQDQLRMVSAYDDDVGWTDTRMLRQARRDAATLSSLIGARTGRRSPWVQPVIAWWGHFEQVGLCVDGVAVVQGAELVPRLAHVAEVQPRPVSDPRAIADALVPGRRRRGTSIPPEGAALARPVRS